MKRGTCIHYTGLPYTASAPKCCAAGVNYDEAFDRRKPGILARMPCVMAIEKPKHGRGTYVRSGEESYLVPMERGDQKMIPCKLYQEPTDEQIRQDREETDAWIAKTTAAIRVASAWRVKPKPLENRSAVVECPVCKGELQLFQSAHNGHVSGECRSPNCVRWVE